MTAYYNEFDPFAAAWLRELIKDGHIAPGDVDERSIVDVRPADLAGYDQCHFFAGIGVWSLALRGAGWADDRPVWTGSCPCQPFSAAGKGAGFSDERHLWPAFFNLIRECCPDVILGEQVASKDGLAWLDLVHADLEGADYACGAVDTCAAGFGAPHIRQRLWWVGLADAGRAFGNGRGPNVGGPVSENPALGNKETVLHKRCGCAFGLADTHDTERGAKSPGRDDRNGKDAGRAQGSGHAGACGGRGGLADAASLGHDGRRAGEAGDEPGAVERPERLRDVDRMADADSAGAQREPRNAPEAAGLPQAQRQSEHDADVPQRGGADRDGRGDLRGDGLSCDAARPGPTNGLWAAADWLACRDGKWRPVEPGTFPLAHAGAYRNRVGLLRGAGNAVNLAQAQGFCEAVMESVR